MAYSSGKAMDENERAALISVHDAIENKDLIQNDDYFGLIFPVDEDAQTTGDDNDACNHLGYRRLSFWDLTDMACFLVAYRISP